MKYLNNPFVKDLLKAVAITIATSVAKKVVFQGFGSLIPSGFKNKGTVLTATQSLNNGKSTRTTTLSAVDDPKIELPFSNALTYDRLKEKIDELDLANRFDDDASFSLSDALADLVLHRGNPAVFYDISPEEGSLETGTGLTIGVYDKDGGIIERILLDNSNTLG